MSAFNLDMFRRQPRRSMYLRKQSNVLFKACYLDRSKCYVMSPLHKYEVNEHQSHGRQNLSDFLDWRGTSDISKVCRVQMSQTCFIIIITLLLNNLEGLLMVRTGSLGRAGVPYGGQAYAKSSSFLVS